MGSWEDSIHTGTASTNTMYGSRYRKRVRRAEISACWKRDPDRLVVTFFNITDPFNMEDTPEPEMAPRENAMRDIFRPPEDGSAGSYTGMSFDQAPGLEALSAAATSNFQYSRPLAVATPSPGDINASPHSSNNLNFILNPTNTDASAGTLEIPKGASLVLLLTKSTQTLPLQQSTRH